MKGIFCRILSITLYISLLSQSFIFHAHCHGTVEDGVAVLSEHSIKPFIAAHDFVLIKFYAPWCVHCKDLAPKFAEAAKMLAEEKSPIILAKIDVDNAKSLIEAFGIEGYPTLKFFKKGVPLEYDGPREAAGIVSKCKELMKPALEEVEAFVPEDKVALVATEPAADLLECLTKEAEVHRSSIKSYLVKGGDSKVSKIEVYQPGEGLVEFTGKTCEELSTFITTESLPLFSEIDQTNYLKYISSGKDISWFCGTSEDYESHKDVFIKAARAMRESVSFVWLDSVKFSAVKDAFAIEKLPSVAHQTQSGRYILESDSYDISSHDEVMRFYKDVAEGKVVKSVRSEEEPETNDGSVKIIVGKTLEPLVTKSEKDILLMVYAPHCEHCKKFMPEFEAFAKDHKFDNLMVAKINGDANESPVDFITWDAFPTVYFIKSGSNSAVSFDGERSKEVLSEFVSEQRTVVHPEL